MTVRNTIREPFFHTDVATIVTEVASKIHLSPDQSLSMEVTRQVKIALWLRLYRVSSPNLCEEDIQRIQLPERVKTWIYQFSMHAVNPEMGPVNFQGKVAEPIDLKSLPPIKKIPN